MSVPPLPDPQEEAEVFRGLGARLLDPSRPQRAAVADALGATTNRRQAWERMATRGFIPEEWVESPRRRFVCEPYPSWICRFDSAAGIRKAVVPRTLPHPPSIGAIATLASGPASVTTAEAFAAELVGRYARLADLPPFGGVLWRVLPAHSRYWRKPLDRIGEAIFGAAYRDTLRADGASLSDSWYSGSTTPNVKDLKRRADSAFKSFSGGFESAQKDWGAIQFRDEVDSVHAAIRGCFTLESAQREDLRVGSEFLPLSRLRAGERWAEVLNPFVASIGLVAEGYSLFKLETFQGATWPVLVALAVTDFGMPETTVRRSIRRD